MAPERGRNSLSEAAMFDAKIDKLWEAVIQQHAVLEEIHSESVAMRRCLESAGLISCRDFDIEMHRVRFASVIRRHPLAQTTNMQNAMHLEGIALKIGQCLDETSGLHLGEASRALHSAAVLVSRIFVIGGIDMDPHKAATSNNTTVSRLDTRCGTWEAMSPMPKGRSRAASAIAMGKLYVIGGMNNNHQALADCDCLDLMSGTWEAGPPPMSAPRAAHSAACRMGSEIYVVGGSSDGRHLLHTVERFNVNKQTWHTAPPMAIPRGTCACVSMDNQLYAIGGCNARGLLNSVERLSYQGKAWKPTRAMTQVRADFAALVHIDRIFVMGGFSSGNRVVPSVECYRQDTGLWEVMPDMLWPSAACTAAASRGRIYVLGGTNGRHSLSGTQYLLPGQSEWKEGPQMQDRRANLFAAPCWDHSRKGSKRSSSKQKKTKCPDPDAEQKENNSDSSVSTIINVF
mmetsp:Transcript_29490/g.53696  ORF Transcript_29490/g.53696 Transcript_29490/m.53696 type:complete len:458 (-) Transcript_29490:138-1511(-)